MPFEIFFISEIMLFFFSFFFLSELVHFIVENDLPFDGLEVCILFLDDGFPYVFLYG